MTAQSFTRRRLEKITIKEVGTGSVSTTDSTGFGVPAHVAESVKSGEEYFVELYRFNDIGGLMKPDGEYLFHRTDEYFSRKHEEWLAKYKRDLEERYEANKDDWLKRTYALPPRYRDRLDRFINDPEEGEQFRKEGMGWGYELIICELACLYEQHGFGGGSFDTEPAEVQEFARKHGTSGNQHDVARAWAKNPEEKI